MMHAARTLAVVLMLAIASTASAPAWSQETDAQYTCQQGPIRKTIGGTEWSIYSCTDELTLVFIAVEGSPASPFLFILSPDGDGYVLHGQGTGDKAATAAARDEIGTFNEEVVRALIAETKEM